MALSWPAGLPHEPAEGMYGIAQSDLPPISSPMQSGRVRMRRQFTARIAQMKWGRLYTSEQLAIFRTFHRDTLGAGTAAFMMPVLDAAMRQYVPREVQIQGGSSGIAEELVGRQTRVSCVLLVRNL